MAATDLAVVKTAVFLLDGLHVFHSLFHGFVQSRILGTRNIGRLHGLAAPAAQRRIPARPFGKLVVISALGLLSINQDLYAPLHGGFQGGNARHAIRLAQGIHANGLRIGSRRGVRLGKFALLVLARHQIANGPLDGLPIFFRSRSLSMRQIGQDSQSRHGFLVMRSPRSILVLVDAQPLQGAQHRRFGKLSPLAAIGADGSLAAGSAAVGHVAGGQVLHHNRADGVGRHIQFGHRVHDGGGGKILHIRRRRHVHVDIRRRDGIHHVRQLLGRLQILQQLVQLLIIGINDLDLDLGGLLLRGKIHQKQQGQNQGHVNDDRARRPRHPFHDILMQRLDGAIHGYLRSSTLLKSSSTH